MTRITMLSAVIAAASLAVDSLAFAQSIATRSLSTPAQTSIGETLLADARVQAALAAIEKNEPDLLTEQIRICEVPAPPFGERNRGEVIRAAFEGLGLANVRTDGAGNVVGERAGVASRPHVVISAHLDTVFPEGTDVTVTRSGALLKGPGISDDCRGLAVLLAVVRQLNEARIETAGSITFVATVGEEGLGDLRGVKHLFAGDLGGGVDAFVSIDGSGSSITHVAVGSRRYRVAYKGPGGHSYGDFGLANPVHALGRAIARIADLQVPTLPKATFNVGRIGGGTSVNSIAFEAWMEVDLRSADRAALIALEAGFLKATEVALAEENERWGNRGQLTLERTLVGDRPAGRSPETGPLVQAAVSVSRAAGLEPELKEGSTDANLAMSLGIPAITIDGGGSESSTHSLEEVFDSTESWKGTARAFLLVLAIAR